MFRLITTPRTSIHRVRSIWTTRTITSPSPQSIIDQLSSTPTSTSSSTDRTTLYTLSKHFPQDLLHQLQRSLPRGTTIGCLSEVDDLTTSSSIPPFQLSLATYTPSSTKSSTLAIPFRSTLTGRPNVSLGREHKYLLRAEESKRSSESLEFEDRGFEAFLRGDEGWGFGDNNTMRSKGLNDVVKFQEFKDIDPRDVKELICFTADRIQPFLAALSCFPNANILGMTSTSTPFHHPSQQPFVLFYNDEIQHNGAVGVAVVNNSSGNNGNESAAKKEVEVEYRGMEMFGEVQEVTNSRGNIVLTLSDNKNAAQLLLSSVQELSSKSKSTKGEKPEEEFEPSMSNPNERSTRHISKEKEFYAAIFEPDTDLSTSTATGGEGVVDLLGRSKLVCRIMAGDPKRGAVSFETEEEVSKGDQVIFLHRPTKSSTTPSTTSTSSSSTTSSSSSPTFTFSTISPSYVSPILSHSSLPSNSPSTKVEDIEDTPFQSQSENGIIVSRKVGNTIEVRLNQIEGTVVKL